MAQHAFTNVDERNRLPQKMIGKESSPVTVCCFKCSSGSVPDFSSYYLNAKIIPFLLFLKKEE